MAAKAVNSISLLELPDNKLHCIALPFEGDMITVKEFMDNVRKEVKCTCRVMVGDRLIKESDGSFVSSCSTIPHGTSIPAKVIIRYL